MQVSVVRFRPWAPRYLFAAVLGRPHPSANRQKPFKYQALVPPSPSGAVRSRSRTPAPDWYATGTLEKLVHSSVPIIFVVGEPAPASGPNHDDAIERHRHQQRQTARQGIHAERRPRPERAG